MKNSVLSLLMLCALVVFSVNGAWAQFEYIFPSNGSINNFRETHLILRNGAMMDPASVTADKITITGSMSGEVAASVILSTDGKTVCIAPVHSFQYKETVTVNVKPGLKILSGKALTGTSFSFSIRREMTELEKQQLQEYLSTHDDDGNLINDPNQQSTYVPFENTNRDNFDFVNIYVNNNPSPGEIFFHRNSGSSPTTSSFIGYGIMTPAGDSLFYRPSLIDGANFHINGNGYLTALRLDPGVDTGIIVMDQDYNLMYEVHGQNGLSPSQHEHLFFPDGSKWFTCYDWQAGWNLQPYGGPDGSTVNVSWIQALDGNNNVIFQWRSDEHFLITDAAGDILSTISQSTFDPWHINSMWKDNDGKIIASFRNMDMIVKIDPSNGHIIWYWGGYNVDYFPKITTTNDPTTGGFSHMHNVHRIENGNILMFDNSSNLRNPQISRPKEYTLNESNFTANCIWYYTHPTVNGFQMFTKNQGSANRLPNGNTIIGYGLPNIQGLPNGAEIDAAGNIVWEFRFKDSTEYSYRIYKGPLNVGISEVAAENDLQVFPNPTDGFVTLDIDMPLAGEVNISLVNVLGQVVYSKSENYHSGKQQSTLDLTSLDKGFYFVNISCGKVKMVDRILVQ